MQKQNNITHFCNEPTLEHIRSVSACVSDVGNHKEQCSSLSSGTKAQKSKKGAPPSNTAPTNCKKQDKPLIQVLRSGVDSLYLSYSGVLFSEQDAALSSLKKAAKSTNEIEHAIATYRHGEHLFKVMDKGAGRFSYVLADHAYRIQLSSPTARSIPLAYVQVKSDWLAKYGVNTSSDELTGIIDSFGSIEAYPTVSRADLFVDFTCDFSFEQLTRIAWLCRARQYSNYWVGPVFTGFSFGLGGDISARLYNKTEEIKKSGKDYLKYLWLEKGWSGAQDVWRLEFQFKRKILGEHQVRTVDELLDRLGPLWVYASTQWLKLTVPSLTDDTKSRWPLHPVWAELAQVDWGECSETASVPIRDTTAPSDRYLFERGLASITSFMARENISDISIAAPEFIRQARIHHASREEFTCSNLDLYAKEKAALKARKFNLPFAGFEEDGKKLANKARAEVYRKAKDGE
jgi:hypothetical protein